jgi:hypothetical protein
MDVLDRLDRLEARLAKLDRAVKNLSTSVDKKLTTSLAALALKTKRMAVNAGPVTAGSTDHTIVWPVPFADDNYFVSVEVLSGAAGIGALHAQLKIGSRTPSQSEITLTSTGNVAVVILDVLAVRP